MEQDRAGTTASITLPPAEKREASLAECLDALDRLVRGGALDVGSRGYNLLTFLIDHYQKFGPGLPIKAYSIAVDVLDRPTTFDPSEDSIVRVEVGRLRKLLEMYYIGPGRADPLKLRIPKGQSHLELNWGHPSTRSQLSAASTASTAPSRQVWWFLPIAIVVLVGAGIGAYLLRPPEQNPEFQAALSDQFPRLFVRPFQKDERLVASFPNRALSEFLATELSAFSTFRVIDPSSKSLLPVRAQDFVLDGAANVIDMDGDAFEVELRLVLKDGQGTILWSEELRYPLGTMGSPQPTLHAIESIAAKLGGAMGVVDATGRARLNDEIQEWKAGATEFQCLLTWQSYDLTKSASYMIASDCLEDLAKRETRVSQIWAALGFMRLVKWIEAGANPDDIRVDQALEAANRALLLDASGAEGHEALGSVLTALGRISEARSALQAAISLNPSNLDTVVKIGWLDCLEGDWEAGVGDIRTVIDRYTVVPGWYRLPLALDAFRQNAPAEMLSEAEAITASGDSRGLVLAAIASRLLQSAKKDNRYTASLRQSGKTERQALDELEALFPEPEIFSKLQRLAE
jgi:tetratricopeptide (TPR) repeat protein